MSNFLQNMNKWYQFVLENFHLKITESESSGRSVSPSSTLASGSEVEIEDLSTIDPTASGSSYKKSEYRISRQGAGSSPTSVTIPQKYNYSPPTSGVLPGSSQQHMQVL